MAHQKKLIEMSREELLQVVYDLIDAIRRRQVGRDLEPNREANRRHQHMKHVWGRKKLAMIGLLHRAVEHCPSDLEAEIWNLLNHEENHYQKRDAKQRKRDAEMRAMKAARANGTRV